MEIVWEYGPSTVREVVARLKKSRILAYTTVMTVMNRLAKDGHLRRASGPSKSFRYHPTTERGEFAEKCCQHSIEALIERYGDVALAQCLHQMESLPVRRMKRIQRLTKRKHERITKR